MFAEYGSLRLPGSRRSLSQIVPGERLVLTVAEAGGLLSISRAFASCSLDPAGAWKLSIEGELRLAGVIT
jgi:hypothetical protein